MAKHLAVVSGEEELRAAEKLIGKRPGKNDELVVLGYSIEEYPRMKNSGFSVIRPEDFLSNLEMQAVYRKAAFFSSNWHKFDSELCGKMAYRGISIAFSHSLAYFFIATFSRIKTILKAIEKEKPETIIVNRNSPAGEAVRAIAKAAGLRNVLFFELPKRKKPVLLPHFSRKKALEIRKKISILFSELAKAKEKTGSKKTIFIRERGYFGNLKKQLQKQPGINVFSLDEFLLRRIMNPVNALKYFSTVSSWKKKLGLMFDRFSETRAFREKFVFEGINFAPLFRAELARITVLELPEFVFMIDMLSELFRKKKPSAVVLWIDFVPFERICALLARQSGAKSLVLQHGIFKAVAKECNWIRGFAPLAADKIAVWGDFYKKELEKAGVQSERIIVAGAPRFDSLKRLQGNSESTRKKLGIKNHEKLVLFAPQIALKSGYLEFIAGAVKKTQDARLVIRLEEPAGKEDLKNPAGANAVIVRHESLYELLNAADAVITEGSAAGLEAMIAGKPHIMIGQAFSGAGSAGELKKALSVALGSSANSREKNRLEKGRRKFIYRHAFRQDGNATGRIITLVKGMLSEPEKQPKHFPEPEPAE
ncbi:MAG TPA: CDP-glycerol glycerophosphotransferase family protein [archaeon]|nr:CDP-glycerol glycerophosphotransferase family protein [archaeon]